MSDNEQFLKAKTYSGSDDGKLIHLHIMVDAKRMVQLTNASYETEYVIFDVSKNELLKFAQQITDIANTLKDEEVKV